MSAGMVLQHHVPPSAICRYFVFVPENDTTLTAINTMHIPIGKLSTEMTTVTHEIMESPQIRKIVNEARFFPSLHW
jgi:hypothetical protein